MTYDEEQRLRSMLDEAAPAPPHAITGAQLRESAVGPGRSRRVDRPLALVAVAAVVAGVLAVVWWAGRSSPPLPDSEPQPSVSPLDCAKADLYLPPTPTGTAPKTLSASAFGPYAVQDMAYVQWTGASGRAVFHVYPNGPVQWTVFDFTRSYATDQVAAQAVADLAAMLVCHGAERLRPDGGDAVPGASFVHAKFGQWQVLVRVGSKVMELTVMTDGTHLESPGDAFLVGIADAARRSMKGEDPGTAPLPTPTPTAAPAPSGFLVPSTIGQGWQIGTEPGDGLTSVTSAHAPGPDCNGVPVDIAEPGQALVYRGVLPAAPEWNREWLLTENVFTLTAAGREKALAQMAKAADGSLCPRTTVLFSGTGIVGDYVLVEGEKTGGAATVYVVAGDKLIWLLSLPGGAMGSDVPLPGGNQWLIDTAKAAVESAGAG